MDPRVFVGVVVIPALLMAGAFAIVRALRRRSYRRWNAAPRWAFYAIVGALVSLGAVGLVYNYTVKWGALAAAWLLFVPLARGFLMQARDKT